MPDDDRQDDAQDDQKQDDDQKQEEKKEEKKNGPPVSIPRAERNRRWGQWWAQWQPIEERKALVRRDPRSDAALRGLMSAEQLAALKADIADPTTYEGPRNVPYLGTNPAYGTHGRENRRRGTLVTGRVHPYMRADGEVRGYNRARPGEQPRLEQEKARGYMRPRYGYAQYNENGDGERPIEGPRYSWARFGRSAQPETLDYAGEPQWLVDAKAHGRPQRRFETAYEQRRRRG